MVKNKEVRRYISLGVIITAIVGVAAYIFKLPGVHSGGYRRSTSIFAVVCRYAKTLQAHAEDGTGDRPDSPRKGSRHAF